MKVVVEGCDAIYFSARKVQFLRNKRQRLFRHIAKFVLKCMKNGKRCSLLRRMLFDDGARKLAFIVRHSLAFNPLYWF